MFGVTILGNNSALPAYDRHPTCQVVTLNDQVLMIDCGEGTQMQLSKYKIRRSRINHIFISHLHGDHYFGLPGLITSLGLLGREAKLNIYAPALLEGMMLPLLSAAETDLPYELVFHPIRQEGILLEEEKFMVECFPVIHRIECWGFIVKEKKKPRKINKQTIGEFNIPTSFFDRLKDGEDYLDDNGNIVKNADVTIPNTPAKAYAYCADTLYNREMACKIKGVNLLYHETTYLKNLGDKATQRFHSTTEQAANIATLAGVQKLLIGHFSSKYETLDNFLTETQAVFPSTQLAVEGVTYMV
ncbi:MAG TPA: ribonuclease Z [Chitinophagaceae bacterium]|nr:ribonuclease Z [Chitinophagaceae bacterium]